MEKNEPLDPANAVYDPHENKWTVLPGGVFSEHEIYNPATDSRKSLAPMPVPVHGVTGAAFIDGWIHLPGGGTSQGGSSGSTFHQAFRAEMSCR